jgi:hypothetical protein
MTFIDGSGKYMQFIEKVFDYKSEDLRVNAGCII